MKSLWSAALSICLLASVAAPAAAQQKKEATDAEKVRRADIVPEPAPRMYPRAYPGTSFRSLRVTDVQYGYVAVNDKNIFYERMGYGKQNIVVVHGGPGLPHNYLLPALQNLAPYATIWFFDARGHGLSEQNRPNEPYTMEQLTDDLAEFTDAVGLQNFVVLGHSFGGMVALQYAARNPIGLRGLILSDTSPSAEYATQLQETLKKVMPAGEYERYEQAQRDESVPADERLRRAMRIVYPYYWYNAPKGYYLDQDIKSMNLNARANEEIWSSDAGTFDVRQNLGDITVPTLVLVGKYDIVTPMAQAQIIVDGIPGARMYVLHRSGHYPFYEENYLWTQAVAEFLEG